MLVPFYYSFLYNAPNTCARVDRSRDVFTNCNSAFGSLSAVLRSGTSSAASVDTEAIVESLESSGVANLATWLEAQKLLGAGQAEQALKIMSLLGTNNPKYVVRLSLCGAEN